jgi:hypothetical protein
MIQHVLIVLVSVLCQACVCAFIPAASSPKTLTFRSSSSAASARYDLRAHAAAASTDAAQITEFTDWLARNGVKGGDCLLKVGPSHLDGGRGLITTTAVKAGQAVLTVPQALSISGESVLKGPLGKHLAAFEGCTGDTGLIALQLLWEHAQGSSSQIAPWLAVLPPVGSLQLPIFWEAEDLQLADASSTRGFSGLKADIEDDFNWLTANVFTAAQLPQLLKGGQFTLERFSWAVGCALSRSFFVDGALRLTPLIDFANHDDNDIDQSAAAAAPAASGSIAQSTAEQQQQPAEDRTAGAKAAVRGLFNNLAPMVEFGDSSSKTEAVAVAAKSRALFAREPFSCGLGVFGGKGVRLVAGRDQPAGEEVIALNSTIVYCVVVICMFKLYCAIDAYCQPHSRMQCT